MVTRTKQCPLCGTSVLKPEGSARVSDIERLYQAMGVSVINSYEGCNEVSLLRCGECDLLTFDPAVSAEPDFYEALQRKGGYYLEEKAEYHYARRFVSSSDDVLEIGCGSGEFLKFISPHSYLGLETNRSVIGSTLEGGRISGDSLDAHVRDHAGAYDVVCMFQVLEHVPDVRAFLEKAMQCVKSGGKLIISVPNADSFLRYMANNALNLPPHHVTWWSERSLRNLAHYLGAEVLDLKCQRLDEQHAKFYLPSIWRGWLIRRKGNSRELLDISFGKRKSTVFLSRLSSRLKSMLRSPLLGLRGHSISIVLCKQPRRGEASE